MPPGPLPEGDPPAAALKRLLAPGPLDDEERREAAEALHALGTGLPRRPRAAVS
jgi:hypothetical protein